MSSRFSNREARQAVIDVAEELYQVMRAWPAGRNSEMNLRLQQSAMSVLRSIAEGPGRFSRLENARFLVESREFLCTLRTQICLARQRGSVVDRRFEAILARSARVEQRLNVPDRNFRAAVAA